MNEFMSKNKHTPSIIVHHWIVLKALRVLNRGVVSLKSSIQEVWLQHVTRTHNTNQGMELKKKKKKRSLIDGRSALEGERPTV